MMKRMEPSLTTNPLLLTEPFAIEGILGEISRHQVRKADHIERSMPANQQAKPSSMGPVATSRGDQTEHRS